MELGWVLFRLWVDGLIGHCMKFILSFSCMGYDSVVYVVERMWQNEAQVAVGELGLEAL